MLSAFLPCFTVLASPLECLCLRLPLTSVSRSAAGRDSCNNCNNCTPKQRKIITRDEQWPNTLRFTVLFPSYPVEIGRFPARRPLERTSHTSFFQPPGSYSIRSAHNANNSAKGADHRARNTIAVSYLGHNRVRKAIRHWLNLGRESQSQAALRNAMGVKQRCKERAGWLSLHPMANRKQQYKDGSHWLFLCDGRNGSEWCNKGIHWSFLSRPANGSEGYTISWAHAKAIRGRPEERELMRYTLLSSLYALNNAHMN